MSLALTVLSSCAPHPAPPAIDPRLSVQVPADASGIAGFRPAALGNLASTFGDARYVLAFVRGGEVGTAILAPDGNITGAPKRTGSISPLLAEAEPLAERYPAWLVIRGGAGLPLRGNLANLNNLLADADLVTVGVQPGDPFAADLTARCPSEERAKRFEGSLRAVLLLLNVPASHVLRDGATVRADMKVPADLIGKLVR